MEGKVKQLEDQITLAYGVDELKQNPYYLHSICVHEGNATSGHYYTFIYDRFNKKWRRFSDIRVTDVTEEDVF
jgi:ubiquitin carboxyl-terminal hydrolase 25